jgi:F-box and leucine-rich repeat protein 10/11
MDYHIDFGGTSVWYHVISGKKEFCLIKPTPDILKIYEQWYININGQSSFFPDMLLPDHKEHIVRITLQQNQTMIIPSGWIHYVYTPVDSVVTGCNFLHGYDVEMQMIVNNIEEQHITLE